MGKKYELLIDDYINHKGRTLYRIRALRDFGYIKAGDLGGYIQSEENLSHKKNCWVYDDAKVYDNACIYDNAKVFRCAEVYNYAIIRDNAEVNGNAKIYGKARIYDNSLICGHAEVYGNAEICDNAQIYNNAKVYEEAEIYDNAKILGNANIHGNTQVYNYAKIRDNAVVNGNAKIYGYALLYGDAYICNNDIISAVSMPFKKIFQHQCKNRVLTAILTEDNEILYSIGCQINITEKEFVDRIFNTNGGLESNPYREEYLELIPSINIYLKGEHNND